MIYITHFRAKKCVSPDIIDSAARVRKRGRRARIWISGLQLCKFHCARDLLGFLRGRGEGRKHGEGVYHGLDYTLMGILLPSFPLLPAVKWWMCTVRFSIFIFNFTRVFTNLDFLHLTLIDRFTLMDDGIITRNTWKLSFVVGISELRMESNLIIRYFDKKYIW